MAGSCKHRNVTLGTLKGGELPENSSDYQHLQTQAAALN
jgi:hypothetical protein